MIEYDVKFLSGHVIINKKMLIKILVAPKLFLKNVKNSPPSPLRYKCINFNMISNNQIKLKSFSFDNLKVSKRFRK